MPPFASNPLQPLIDFFEEILKFFHETVGFGWGLSIIVLTLFVRACLLPLTLKQFHSMQRLAKVQPEMKRLQEKYKDDKERLNQEMMKFYRENKVNPLRLLPPADRAAAGLHLAVLHAAHGPAVRHLPGGPAARRCPAESLRCRAAPAATPASSSSRT